MVQVRKTWDVNILTTYTHLDDATEMRLIPCIEPVCALTVAWFKLYLYTTDAPANFKALPLLLFATPIGCNASSSALL
eukprot:8960582-Pyramimonas_sp.AAC.1